MKGFGLRRQASLSQRRFCFRSRVVGRLESPKSLTAVSFVRRVLCCACEFEGSCHSASEESRRWRLSSCCDEDEARVSVASPQSVVLSLAISRRLLRVGYASICGLRHILGGGQRQGFEGPSIHAYDGSRELRQLFLGFQWRLETFVAVISVRAELVLVVLSVSIRRICLHSICGRAPWLLSAQARCVRSWSAMGTGVMWVD